MHREEIKTTPVPHLYVHGERDMLAMAESNMPVFFSEESRTSLTVLPFCPAPRPKLALTACFFVEVACNSVVTNSTSKILKT